MLRMYGQAKCNAVTSERDEVREQNSRMQTKIQELKEDVGKKMASNRIEVRCVSKPDCRR